MTDEKMLGRDSPAHSHVRFRRYLLLMTTYRTVKCDDEDEERFVGLSAPFPVTTVAALENALQVCRENGWNLAVVGFFDPLASVNRKKFDGSNTKFIGGLVGNERVLGVHSVETVRDCLRYYHNKYGMDFLGDFFVEKEGESDVESSAV